MVRFSRVWELWFAWSPSGQRARQLVTKDEGKASQFQEDPRRRRGFTTKSDGLWYIAEYTFPGVITGYFTHLEYVRLAP